MEIDRMKVNSVFTRGEMKDRLAHKKQKVRFESRILFENKIKSLEKEER